MSVFVFWLAGLYLGFHFVGSGPLFAMSPCLDLFKIWASR